MRVYDNYEISPCQRFEEPDSPGKLYFEVCEPDQADVWTLYGHINGEGVQAIGDFTAREAAEEVYTRITGLPFTGSYYADAHLRVMHAAPKLLEALQDAREWVVHGEVDGVACDELLVIDILDTAIAEATSGTPRERQPIVIEVRGGVVQDVLNVPAGIEYEIRDYDSPEQTPEAGRAA
jgi:hypothetical protein